MKKQLQGYSVLLIQNGLIIWQVWPIYGLPPSLIQSGRPAAIKEIAEKPIKYLKSFLMCMKSSGENESKSLWKDFWGLEEAER